ncbi:MAG TPA: nuclear transport factor 2 family protein [Candidatus Omnitrophota bacterium]|nr:nuclear transport factor 2 family protein [Candidatus Omnitrophota bacterium]
MNKLKNMIFAILLFFMVAPLNAGAMDEKLKQEIIDTINKKMDQIILYAEAVNADKMLADIAHDKDSAFFASRQKYGADRLIEAFRGMYAGMKGQDIAVMSSKVLVLGPEAAVWIATIKDVTENRESLKEQETLMETWVWQKIDGAWKVVHYHESAFRPIEETTE